MRHQLPNFIVLGAQKCGTTSLIQYLASHPQICVPDFTEPGFFLPNDAGTAASPYERRLRTQVIDSIQSYRALFEPCADKPVRGEASPGYLYAAKAAEAMRDVIPNAKLIVLLRDPTDRAHSAFLHNRRHNAEPEDSFAAALKQEPHRRKAGWSMGYHYSQRSKYYQQLRRYLHRFPREQLILIRFRKFINETASTLINVLGSLGLSLEDEVDYDRRYNTYRPVWMDRIVNLLLDYFPAGRTIREHVDISHASWLLERFKSLKPTASKEARDIVISRCIEDIRQLENLTGWDLSHWKALE